MKKKIISIISSVILLVMVLSLNSSLTVFAEYGNDRVRVPTDCVMKIAKANLTRTGNYSYVTVTADSVYPTDGSTDNFTKCKTKLTENKVVSPYEISEVYTLVEGTPYNVKIKEGYLQISPFRLYFSGNDERYSAYIAYTYNTH